jgi:FKBP-type peptidyl-prolyl cis-trans isomerase FkpA
MRKNLAIFVMAALAFAGCKSGLKQGPGGMLYSIHTDKSGQNIKEGDFISFNLILKTEGDSVLGSTYELGRPIRQLVQKEQHKGDLTTGMLMLSEGDSATIKLNIDSMFKKGMPKPPGIKGKYMVYEVKIDKVIPKGTLTDPLFQAKISEYFKKEADELKKAEPAQIKKYVADKNLKTTTTATGLQYVITKPGSGDNLKNGDTAVVNYTGKLLNGKLFDSSIKEEFVKAKAQFDPRRRFEPMRLPVGAGGVIKGWDEGLLLLNKGSKATFVIPSSLGWGEQGAPPLLTHL